MFYELSGYTLDGRVEEALKVNREKFSVQLAEACTMPDSADIGFGMRSPLDPVRFAVDQARGGKRLPA
jgi:hypothetical protein